MWIDPEPGALGGRAESQKIEDDTSTTLKTIQKYPPVQEFFSVDAIPFYLVGDISLLGE